MECEDGRGASLTEMTIICPRAKDGLGAVGTMTSMRHETNTFVIRIIKIHMHCAGIEDWGVSGVQFESGADFARSMIVEHGAVTSAVETCNRHSSNKSGIRVAMDRDPFRFKLRLQCWVYVY